jgi:hypothetical protein
LFYWYWWNCWPSLFKLSFVLLILVELLTMMVNNSTNINKTKESLNNDGQQFYQHQQNKRKFKQWWSSIPPISIKHIGGIVDHHCLNFFCFIDIGGIVDHHCLNFLLFCWYWWNCGPSLCQQSHQYQQNKESLNSDGQ